MHLQLLLGDVGLVEKITRKRLHGVGGGGRAEVGVDPRDHVPPAVQRVDRPAAVHAAHRAERQQPQLRQRQQSGAPQRRLPDAVQVVDEVPQLRLQPAQRGWARRPALCWRRIAVVQRHRHDQRFARVAARGDAAQVHGVAQQLGRKVRVGV